MNVNSGFAGNSEAAIGRVFCKKGALKKFAIFTGKHLFWSLFLIGLLESLYFAL